MNRADTIKAINAGAIAACVSGTLTLIVSLIAIGANSSEDTLGNFNDPLIFFDVGLIFLMAFFIWRKSRVAAVLMFIYFAASKFIITAETGQVSGIFTSVLFLFFFGRAAWGTFVWHKLEKAENPDYRTAKKGWMIAGGVLATLMILMIGLSVIVTSGFTPATTVQMGEELPQSQLDTLREKNIIRPDETVAYYYFSGILKVEAGGTIMTDQRIIGYWNENGEVQSLGYSLDNIDRMILAEEGGVVMDAIYQIAVRGNDESSLLIPVSIENDRHLEMISALEKHISENTARDAAVSE